MKRPIQAINEIILGKKAVTAETALQLEAKLGMSAEAWMGLESDYRLALARQEQDPVDLHYEVLKRFAKDFVHRPVDERWTGFLKFTEEVSVFGNIDQIISDTCSWLEQGGPEITATLKRAEVDEGTVHMFTFLNKSIEAAK